VAGGAEGIGAEKGLGAEEVGEEDFFEEVGGGTGVGVADFFEEVEEEAGVEDPEEVEGRTGVGVAGAAGAVIGETSEPSGANGFALPSVPSGVRMMLESCKLLKAGSEKIESSSFMVLTLNKRLRKSPVAEEVPPTFVAPVPELFAPGKEVLAGEDTKLA